MGNTMSNFFDR